jgi:hypothetical protein
MRAVRILEESAAGVKVSVRRSAAQVGGGRTWWAHFEFTPRDSRIFQEGSDGHGDLR